MITVTLDDEDTEPTYGASVLARLRAQGAFRPAVVVEWGAASDRGPVRPENEDRWGHVGDHVFVVADGMGGHEGGELASEAVVDAVCRGGAPVSRANAHTLVEDANEAVLDAGARHGVEGLGSTMALMSFGEGQVLVANVGDSRVYRLRDGEVEQLTEDHNVRRQLLGAGLEPSWVDGVRVRLDALTSYLGTPASETREIGLATFSLQIGDRFLACSDGVHGQLAPSGLAAAMSAGSCADAAQALVDAAIAAGGRDNATAVVVEIGLHEVTS